MMRRLMKRQNLLMASAFFLLALMCCHRGAHGLGMSIHVAHNVHKVVHQHSIIHKAIGPKATFWHAHHAITTKLNIQNSSDDVSLPQSSFEICSQFKTPFQYYDNLFLQERKIWLLNRSLLI